MLREAFFRSGTMNAAQTKPQTISKQFLTIRMVTEGHGMACRSLSTLPALLVAFLAGAAPQQPKAVLPMVSRGAIPLYPPLARASKVQGLVHIKIVTDGTKVVTAHAEDGNRLLAAASEENARTWQFSKHEPTSFTVTYRYRLDANADPNNPTVTLRFPTEVDVSIAPLLLSDPPAEIRK
jgi:hypothetical protein